MLVCGDLIVQTKIVSTARQLGRSIDVVSTGAMIAENPDVSLVLIDLNAPATTSDELIRIRNTFPSPVVIIAFGSHVDVPRLQDARKAGLDRVMPRSEFTRDLVSLLTS